MKQADFNRLMQLLGETADIFEKDAKESKKQEAERATNSQKEDLLSAFENISTLAKLTHLGDEMFGQANENIDYVVEKLGLTPRESVVLAVLIDVNPSVSVSINDIASSMECRPLRVMRFSKELESLEKRDLVVCDRGSSSHTYRVPSDVIEAFMKDEKYEPRNLSGITCHELFAELERLCEMKGDEELTYERFVEKVRYLLDKNQHLEFVRNVLKYDFNDDVLMLLLAFCNSYVNMNTEMTPFYEVDYVFDEKDSGVKQRHKFMLSNGAHELQIANLIDYGFDDGFADKGSYMLTRTAKEELLPELKGTSAIGKKQWGSITKSADLKERKLFFSPEVEEQIEELRGLLDDAHYKEICKRLDESNFRSGFTCLFYGDPGTGKTESVLQLARMTGRDIMQVNFAQLKSMWVGESEKNVKSIFDTYRRIVQQNEIAPILLFNEADAIIGIRKKKADRAIEKMENSIQNIILQEMETLKGIMIATTNLAENIDKAFERRFLYKIKFPRPTKEARISIWREMIPGLTEEQLTTLAGMYEFSGGQIENIARLHTIDKILHGEQADTMENLLKHCAAERLDNGENVRVGFGRS